MDPILTALSAYGGKYQKIIIGQIFLKLQGQGFTVLEGIKGKTKMPKLTVTAGIKPYTGTHSPTDRLTFSDRAVDPQEFQLDGAIEPLKFRNSYMTEVLSKSAADKQIPYENFIWKKISEAIAEEILKKAFYKGIQGGVNLDAAYNINDGIEKRITDMIAAGKAAVATGAITAANAVTKFETFYNDAMSTYEALRDESLTLYCSYGNLDNYTDHYRTLFSNDPQNWSDGDRPMYLKKNKGKVKIMPVAWLGTSERLILTKEENLILATDSLGDLSKIALVPDVYSLKYGITGTIDTQVPDTDFIFYNDQA